MRHQDLNLYRHMIALNISTVEKSKLLIGYVTKLYIKQSSFGKSPTSRDSYIFTVQQHSSQPHPLILKTLLNKKALSFENKLALFAQVTFVKGAAFKASYETSALRQLYSQGHEHLPSLGSVRVRSHFFSPPSPSHFFPVPLPFFAIKRLWSSGWLVRWFMVSRYPVVEVWSYRVALEGRV